MPTCIYSAKTEKGTLHANNEKSDLKSATTKNLKVETNKLAIQTACDLP